MDTAIFKIIRLLSICPFFVFQPTGEPAGFVVDRDRSSFDAADCYPWSHDQRRGMGGIPSVMGHTTKQQFISMVCLPWQQLLPMLPNACHSEPERMPEIQNSSWHFDMLERRNPAILSSRPATCLFSKLRGQRLCSEQLQNQGATTYRATLANLYPTYRAYYWREEGRTLTSFLMLFGAALTDCSEGFGELAFESLWAIICFPPHKVIHPKFQHIQHASPQSLRQGPFMWATAAAALSHQKVGRNKHLDQAENEAADAADLSWAWNARPVEGSTKGFGVDGNDDYQESHQMAISNSKVI